MKKRAQTLSAPQAGVLKLKLTDVANAALGVARVLHLGDTNHRYNSSLMRWAGRPSTLRSFNAAGVTDIYLEQPKCDQQLCDALVERRITTAFFAASASPNIHRADQQASLREIATLLKGAYRAGIKVHCADSCPQSQEQNRLSALLKHISGGKIDVASLLASASEFKRFLTDKMLDAEARNDQAAIEEILVYQLAVIMQAQKFNEARRDDRALAALIAKTLPQDGRAVVIYGAHHGTGKFGLGRELRRRGLDSRKIDVFAEASLRLENRATPRNGDYLFKEAIFVPV